MKCASEWGRATLLWAMLWGAAACGSGTWTLTGGDASAEDGGQGSDAGWVQDAGWAGDAGSQDAGSQDAGSEDAGSEDAGTLDAGPEDAGADAGWPRLPTGHVDRSDLLPANNGSTTGVALADLDGDGDLDIIWTSQPGPDGSGLEGGVDIDFNEGGTFRAGDRTHLETLGSWTFPTVIDADGDGDPDLVLTRPSIVRIGVTLLRNDGTGALVQDPAAIPSILGDPDGIIFGRATAADIDGDGDVDLLVPVSFDAQLTGDRPNILLVNQGDGTFLRDDTGRLPTFPMYTDYTFTACLADVTGDGAPDLYLGEAEMMQRLLINDGTGRFLDQTEDDGTGVRRLPADPLRSYDCRSGDADGDGDLDLLVASDVGQDANGAPVTWDSHLLRNDGSGHLSYEVLPSALAGSDTRAAVFVDLDGSGRRDDIALGNAFQTLANEGKALEFLTLAGTGYDVMGGLPTWATGVFGIAVGDLDGDGRDDLVMAVAEEDATMNMTNILLLSR